MNISDELLLSSYYEAIRRKLDSEFIELLKKEIDRRNLEINDQHHLSSETDNE